MPPDSPIEDVSCPPIPFSQDYPSSSSDTTSYPNSPVPPPPRSPKSGFVFVFDSSASSGWARKSSVHRDRPTLSPPPTTCSSDGSTSSSSFGSVSSFRSAASQLPPWWHPGESGDRGDGGDTNWKRTRKYQTRLTAEECFEHAFSSPRKAREWQIVRSTTSNALASSRSLSEVYLRPELLQVHTTPATTALTRRNSGGVFLGNDHEQRTKLEGYYVPLPKGTFISRSTLIDRKHLSDSATPASPPSASSTSSSSISSEPPTLVSISTVYSTIYGTSVAVREPLLSREDWEEASARRKEQSRRTRQLSSSCNGSARSRDSVDFPLYANTEPISISSQYIGGWTGLEIPSTERIRRHPSLRERGSSSQARHPFQDLKPRPPESPCSELGSVEASVCATGFPVEGGASGADEEKLTLGVNDENMALWLEIFSHLASYLGGNESP